MNTAIGNDECRLQKEPANKADFPDRPRPVAGITQIYRRAVVTELAALWLCDAIPKSAGSQAGRCSRPAPGLSPDIAAALKEVMPGAGKFLSGALRIYQTRRLCSGW